MFLLAGLMGIMAIGVTGFFGYEHFKPDQSKPYLLTKRIQPAFILPHKMRVDTAEMTLSQRLGREHQPKVKDFSAQKDNLLVVFDDRKDPNPKVRLETDLKDEARKHITLNGVRIAAVDDAQGLKLDHIRLIRKSALRRMRTARKSADRRHAA